MKCWNNEKLWNKFLKTRKTCQSRFPNLQHNCKSVFRILFPLFSEIVNRTRIILVFIFEKHKKSFEKWYQTGPNTLWISMLLCISVNLKIAIVGQLKNVSICYVVEVRNNFKLNVRVIGFTDVSTESVFTILPYEFFRKYKTHIIRFFFRPTTTNLKFSSQYFTKIRVVRSWTLIMH